MFISNPQIHLSYISGRPVEEEPTPEHSSHPVEEPLLPDKPDLKVLIADSF